MLSKGIPDDLGLDGMCGDAFSMIEQWNEQYCHALPLHFVIPKEVRRSFIGVEMLSA